jgi:soluble P-type ATPase
MFRAAALSIAVLESEGLYAPILASADLLTKSSEDALDLLLDGKRLLSGLRG